MVLKDSFMLPNSGFCGSCNVPNPSLEVHFPVDVQAGGFRKRGLRVESVLCSDCHVGEHGVFGGLPCRKVLALGVLMGALGE